MTTTPSAGSPQRSSAELWIVALLDEEFLGRRRELELEPVLRQAFEDLGQLVIDDGLQVVTGEGLEDDRVVRVEESRRLVPHQNATTMQVAFSVVAAAMWMIENPARGVCVPDDLPHEFVLKIARPYLGKSISKPSDWTPLKHYRNAFKGYNKPSIDRSDPWQFTNFLITDGD